MRRFVGRVSVLLVFPVVVSASPPASADVPSLDETVIAGIVTNAEDATPLGGIQVHVEGLGLGTFTNAAGEFLIFGVPVGERQIRFEGQCHYGVAVDVAVTGRESDVRRIDVGLPFNHMEARALGCRGG